MPTLIMLLSAAMALGLVACASEESPTEPSNGLSTAAAVRGTYTPIDLGSFGGAFGYSFAWDINEAGQVAGTSQMGFNSPVEHAVLWTKAGMRDLGTLAGTRSEATGINSAGQVVGTSMTLAPPNPQNSVHAFLWENGRMIDLGTLGGRESEATDINPAGQIVGFSFTAVGETHAFIWKKGVMRDLHVGEATVIDPTGESAAAAINSARRVVGRQSTAQGTHAFLWKKGVVTDLGTLGGCCSEAKAINSAGQVVGFSYLPGNQIYHAFLWHKGVMTDLGTLGHRGADETSEARGINAKGQIVGTSGNRAFVWEKGVMTELVSLDTRFSAQAEAINASGQIVGYSTTERGTKATLWTRK